MYSAQPPQRYQTVPASHAGDARDILRPGGDFTNLDNLNGYNLAGTGLAPTAMNDSPVHDLMQGGTIHSLPGASAFNNNRLSNDGMIQGPGTGTSDSVAAVANGQPVAVSNGKFRVPAAVVQALGRNFFDELVSRCIAHIQFRTRGQDFVVQVDDDLAGQFGFALRTRCRSPTSLATSTPSGVEKVLNGSWFLVLGFWFLVSHRSGRGWVVIGNRLGTGLVSGWFHLAYMNERKVALRSAVVNWY